MFNKRKDGTPGGDSARLNPAASAPAKQASRPDASAVLNRQPAPPVSSSPRRPAEVTPERVPAAAAPSPSSHGSEAEGKKLIVGRGIRLSGEITSCEKLVVEGQVEADLTGAQVLEIADEGLFNGRAVVDYAEISGTFKGELTVRDRLLLRGSGIVEGTLTYAEMEIERGGKVRGSIDELSESGAAQATAASAAPKANEKPAEKAPETADQKTPLEAAAETVGDA
jgi:cytoskeletal protein CcmA (bactofilin family)